MTEKTFTHHTTTNGTTKNIQDDKPLIIEVVMAIAKREKVKPEQIKINLKSIKETVHGIFCPNGDTFAISITIDYKVSTTNQG